MTSTPHDGLFKEFFGRPEHARGELESRLPRPLAQGLDWDTLTLVPGQFRDAELARYETDLLFSVATRSGGEALIYVLFEHQSTPERQMAFRLLRYLVRIWESFRRECGEAAPLPLVIPLVLYHGAEPWSAPLAFEHLVAVPHGLGKVVGAYIPSFRYLVDDLSRVGDEELRQRQLTALARLVAVCLRDLRDRHVLEAFGPWVAEWADVTRQESTTDDLLLVFHYILRVKDPDEVEALGSFLEREVGPEAREVLMTAAEKLIRQGIEQGIEQGTLAGERKVLLTQLRDRFGELDAATEQRIATAESWQLETWVRRVLSATSLAEVFAD